jgi:hypothetical protein
MGNRPAYSTTAFWRHPAGRPRPCRRPRRPLGAGVPPRAPPPPAGAACNQAARGGARSGQAPLLDTETINSKIPKDE